MRRTLALTLAVPMLLSLVAASNATDGVTRGSEAALAADPDPTNPVEQSAPRDTPMVVAPWTTMPDPAPARPGSEGTVDEVARPTGTATDAIASQAETADRDGPIESSFLIAPVPEAGAVAGSGRRWRYTVEVEAGLGIDPTTLAGEIRTALNDERSWARTRTLEQVSDPSQARIRIVLASPGTVDELCGRAGLRTAGIYSCWNGRFAALNSWRWEAGADGFEDLVTYRTYLVNHEFGHGLGYGHVGCPTEGALAPVMMQQSKGHDGCIANGWPYP